MIGLNEMYLWGDMEMFDQFKREGGQGLVEYGLILALVSVVAVSSLGNVGDKVSNTFKTVDDLGIDAKIANGYVPVSSADDLLSLSTFGDSRMFGIGTRWAKEYTPSENGDYVLVSDINLKDKVFIPVGTTEKPFSGSFDGMGHTISNLTINHKNHSGFFGYMEGALVENITLSKVHVKGSIYVGGLVGYMTGSTVRNSHVTGDVSGEYNTGGLVGRQIDSNVYDSSTKVHAKGSGLHTGGLVGSQTNSMIQSSYSTSSVTGNGNGVGGLLGYQSVQSAVRNSYSLSSVDGLADAFGGLVGFQNDSEISHSYSAGHVKSVGTGGGILGGQITSKVLNSYYDKDITKYSDFGKGVGKTTEEMWDLSTYDQWDEDVWDIFEGQYPQLKWQSDK